jgi:hypothetical protein
LATSDYVVSLRYILDSLTRYDAEPIAFENNGIRFRLSDNVLHASPTPPISTIVETRRAVETVLRSWKLQEQLLDPSTLFRFAYQDAETVGDVTDADNHPSEQLEYVKDEEESLVISMRRYPDPPEIHATPEIEAAAERLRRAVFGFGEPLQSAAYFALTLAEQEAGDRKAAASQFRLDREILSRIGLLSSRKGDLATARKASDVNPVPLTKEEHRWLERAVRYLLLQMGQVKAGRVPADITMQDLA